MGVLERVREEYVIKKIVTFVNTIFRVSAMDMFIFYVYYLSPSSSDIRPVSKEEIKRYLICWEIDNWCMTIDSPYDILDRVEYDGIWFLSLGNDTEICKFYLFESCSCILSEIIYDIECIDQTDDTIEPDSSSHVIHEMIVRSVGAHWVLRTRWWCSLSLVTCEQLFDRFHKIFRTVQQMHPFDISTISSVDFLWAPHRFQ